MKTIKTLLLLIIVTMTVACSAQTVISVEQYSQYVNNRQGLPNSVMEIRDSNHTLQELTGDWTIEMGGHNYLFRFQMSTETIGGITEDILNLNYKVTDANNNVLENHLTNDLEDSISFSDYLINGSVIMDMSGSNLCNPDGVLVITPQRTSLSGTYDIIEITYVEKPGIIILDLCPNGSEQGTFTNGQVFMMTKI